MNIPFVDLKAQYHSIQDEIRKEINEVLENTSFVLGPKVQQFEKDFSKFVGTKHAIAVNSGTSALHLAYLAAGLKPGDEVITVSHTFVATIAPLIYIGAKPIFVDIDPVTYTMDVAPIEQAITSKTKAIVPVHLYGQPADLKPILEIAKKYNLTVIEDAAQAHGAEYLLGAQKNEQEKEEEAKKNVGHTFPDSLSWKRVGAFGHIGCFSFYPGKNLGAYGEGGMVVTNDDEIAEKIKMLRDHGSKNKYYHDLIGYNYRMSGIQGAVLGVKLKYLNEWTEKRRQNAQKYNELLSSLPIGLPIEKEDRKHVYHLYVIRTKERNALQSHLKERGVATGLHYPIPVHLQKAYKFLGYKNGDFPVTENIVDEILSLPMYPELTEEEIHYVTVSIEEFFRS